MQSTEVGRFAFNSVGNQQSHGFGGCEIRGGQYDVYVGRNVVETPLTLFRLGKLTRVIRIDHNELRGSECKCPVESIHPVSPAKRSACK